MHDIILPAGFKDEDVGLDEGPCLREAARAASHAPTATPPMAVLEHNRPGARREETLRIARC